MSISEKILHIIECYQKNEGQKRIDCHSIKKNSMKKFSCDVCPGYKIKNQQTLANHIQGRRKRGCIAHEKKQSKRDLYLCKMQKQIQ